MSADAPPSDRDVAALTPLVRVGLTAVNQQFTHITVLRDWGDRALATRIEEVDNADFPTAMRIVDHLVARGVVPSPGPDRFVPGVTRAQVLRAERAVEDSWAVALAEAQCDDPDARLLVSEAFAPRAAYATWLADQLPKSGVPPREADPALESVNALFALMMTWIEQTLIHAFVHWHRGDPAAADAAWLSCGAAMIRSTGLTRALAAVGTAPMPGGLGAPHVTGDAAKAVDLDRDIARRCAERARAAAGSTADEALAAECRASADIAAAIASWCPADGHPARATNPKRLTSFEATLRRYVRTRRPVA